MPHDPDLEELQGIRALMCQVLHSPVVFAERTRIDERPDGCPSQFQVGEERRERQLRTAPAYEANMVPASKAVPATKKPRIASSV
jgi:hypothetical protein